MEKKTNSVYFEFIQFQNSIKVNAICEQSGKEVSVIVPKYISQNEMQKLAIKKLDYIKNKNLFNKPNHGTDYKA